MRQKDCNQKMLESMTRSLEIVVRQNQELLRENSKLIEFITEHGSFTFNSSAAVNPNSGDEMTQHRTANFGENKNNSRVKEWRYKVFEENTNLMSMLLTVICFLLDSMDNKEVYFLFFLMLILVIIYVRMKKGLKQYPLR